MKLTSGAKYLVDTNVLVYSVDRNSSHHGASRDVITEALSEEIPLVVAHQNLLEFIAVLTRGYRIQTKEALKDAEAFSQRFDVIFPLFSTFERCLSLIRKAPKPSYPFDVYLAATMLDNDVERIITGNAKDFQNLGLKAIVEI